MNQSQSARLFTLLSDGRPHRTDEILREVYGNEHAGIARIGARIWDIKHRHNVEITSRRDPDNKTLYWYQLVPKKVELPPAREPVPATLFQ